ncbi:MAG: adenylate/guanylate cyclase domain-containing protein, partial [Planctomycetota bacterium]|nr:adenylate/guanylate cyclase domain-containing protein [Planctomycetota bacterium]
VRRLDGGMAGLEPGVLHSLGVEVEGVDYHVGISRQAPEGVPNWIHALVVPDDELIGYFGGYLLAGLLAVGLLLLLAVAAAKLLARRVAQSLDSIAGDLQRVGAFELGERPRLDSRIREIAVVADASERMKASLRSFGRYVPTDLVRDLLAQGQEARLGGVQRPLTLFFSDVAGFTGSSEGMEPERLVGALGEYLEVLTRAVEVHTGTIDKFIGDGVLAFFNAPRADAQHVRHACEAALGVQAALAEAAPDWRARGLPDFSTRIGLHTADVVVGNIGTPERFAYTVIGDGVNLAARLESLNKAYGTSILASQDVRDATGETFVWRAIDRTAVVGRKAGGTVHELLGRSGEVADARLEQARAYEAAFALYLERRFDEAAAAFTRLGAEDAPARILAARAAAYAQQPPPEDWTGVYVQTKK